MDVINVNKHLMVLFGPARSPPLTDKVRIPIILGFPGGVSRPVFIFWI